VPGACATNQKVTREGTNVYVERFGPDFMHAKKEYLAIQRLAKSMKTDEGKIKTTFLLQIMRLEDRVEKLEKYHAKTNTTR